MAKMTFKTKLAQQKLERILDTLRAEPCSAADLGARVGLTQSGVHLYLSHLRQEETGQGRHVYIKEWRSGTSGRLKPVYAVGDKKDKKEPPKKTKVEHLREYRKRMRADPERYRHYLTSERVRSAIRRARENPAMAWIPIRT